MTISGNEARTRRSSSEANAEATLSVAPVTLPFAVGELLAQKYRVESLIGTGGIGFVVAATHVDLGERLALKFLRAEFVTHPEAVRRFASEARHAARIRSEHVARVFDVGSLPDGSPFIVMEYLEGTDLHRLLHREGRLSLERAVTYTLEACEALAAAHACHVVHRDVKPENLFLAEQAHGPSIIKVLDFGISKVALDAAVVEHASTSKQTIGALGSPSYMSPEQMRAAADVDARADIWSLGCVLYQLLTGEHAFDAPSLMQVCAAVLESAPALPTSFRPEIPAGLEAVVMKCLEKEPAQRFQDVGGLAVALLPFAPPHAHASVEKTLRVVQNTRAHGYDEAPPSSKIVRSRPTNDAPASDAPTARSFTTESDSVEPGEPESTASIDAGPAPLTSAPIETSTLADRAPPKTYVPPTASQLDLFTVGGSEPASVAPALDAATAPATIGEAPGPETAPGESPDGNGARRTAALHAAETTIPSVIIRDDRQPPWIEVGTGAKASRRALTQLARPLGGSRAKLLALVVGAVTILTLVWFTRHRATLPPLAARPVITSPATASRVAGTASAEVAAPPAASDSARGASSHDSRGDGLANRKPRTVRAKDAVSARLRAADVPKIEAIAGGVELGTEPEASAGAAVHSSAASGAKPAQAPERAAPTEAQESQQDAPTSAAPPANLPGPAAARSTPGIAPATVARTVRAHANEIQACYDRAEMDHPDIHGRITLRALVDEHGAVTHASASSIENGARLSACITNSAQHWRFPEPPGGGGGSPISYTFVFE